MHDRTLRDLEREILSMQPVLLDGIEEKIGQIFIKQIVHRQIDRHSQL